MDSKSKITISWSGGKDSALSLYRLLSEGNFEIAHMHTVIDRDSRRVGLHGVREEMIELQARQAGFKLIKGYLESSENGDNYSQLMRKMYEDFKMEGITHIMFGDIFLEDLRTYREVLLRDSGIIPVYPLWKKGSVDLINSFIDAGFKTIICSVNEECHDAGLLGAVIGKSLLPDFPAGVDPCGENGEFHSFVFDGPLFGQPIAYALGEVVSRRFQFSVLENDVEQQRTETFFFQDILP